MKNNPTKIIFTILITALFILLSSSVISAERQIVVAASGGDFTTIQDALESIDPTEANPYVIDVMPGRYGVRNLQLKSYLHLRGAGRNVTTIAHYNTPATNIFSVEGLQNVTISGFTFLGDGSPLGGNFGVGLNISNSETVTMVNNTFDHLYRGIYITGGNNHVIKNNVIKGSTYGINLYLADAIIMNNQLSEVAWGGITSNGGSPVISGNVITGSGLGISLRGEQGVTPVVTGNTLTGNTGNAIECRYLTSSAATIKDNIITNNGGHGVYLYYCSSLFTHNRITGNNTDVELHRSPFNGSFNVFDNWSGTGSIMGSYNVNTDGQPIL